MNLPFIFVAEVAPTKTYYLRRRLDAGLSPGLYPRANVDYAETPSWTDGIGADAYWRIYGATGAGLWLGSAEDSVQSYLLLALTLAIGRRLRLDGADRRPKTPF